MKTSRLIFSHFDHNKLKKTVLLTRKWFLDFDLLVKKTPNDLILVQINFLLL